MSTVLYFFTADYFRVAISHQVQSFEPAIKCFAHYFSNSYDQCLIPSNWILLGYKYFVVVEKQKFDKMPWIVAKYGDTLKSFSLDHGQIPSAALQMDISYCVTSVPPLNQTSCAARTRLRGLHFLACTYLSWSLPVSVYRYLFSLFSEKY